MSRKKILSPLAKRHTHHRTLALARQRFHGARFDDHGVDLDVLPELLVFKSLIVEVAKDVWRKKHPDRERLAGNFEERFQVKVFSVHSGSATVPFQRPYTATEDSFSIDPPEDEFDEAVDLITQSINAVEAGKRLPAGISRRVLPYFAQFADHLLPEESMTFMSGRSSISANFNSRTKQLFKERVVADFQDEVMLRGELRCVNLDNQTFTLLRMDDGTKVFGKFSADQESLVTDALQQHRTSLVEIHGKAVFEGSSGELSRVETVDDLRLLPLSDAPTSGSGNRRIWEIAEEIAKTIPEDQWNQFPEDASSNIDHYLYRSARRNE